MNGIKTKTSMLKMLKDRKFDMKPIFLILLFAVNGLVNAQQVLTIPQSVGVGTPATVSQDAALKNQPPKAVIGPTAKKIDSIALDAPASPARSTEKFDPAQVHPEVAVKKTISREVNLPGVLNASGAKELLSSNERVIEANGRSSHVVYLSKIDSNLIVTPFPNPRLIVSKGLAVVQPEGNNLLINIQDQEIKSFQVWIRDANDFANIIGVNVVPKNDLPAQIVTFVLKNNINDGALGAGQSDPYQAAIADKFAKLAQGKKLQGYSAEDASGFPAVLKNSLTIKPVVRYSSNRDDIWEYDVTNVSSLVAVVTKADFCGAQNGECSSTILGVSIFPTDNLAPGQTTKAFVAVSKVKGAN